MKKPTTKEQDWWRRQDLSPLTDLELRMITMRYGLDNDGQPCTLKQVGTALNISTSQVWKLIDRIRVRVDRVALVEAGVAMQLVTDLQLREHLRLNDGGVALTASSMFSSLEAVGVQTYNQLLDKSSKWLFGCGIGRGTVVRVERALNDERMYLRGTLPGDRNMLTSQPHTFTQS